MNHRYNLADGSPRYGTRSVETGATGQAAPRPTPGVRAEEAAAGAARLGLDEMSAAIDRRPRSSCADAPDPLVAGLRSEHPQELTAARALVKLHLGSQRQWRLKAQEVRDRQLAGVTARRRASGSAREILALRLVLLITLIGVPVYVVGADIEDLLRLVLTGVACVVLALISREFINIRARVPVMLVSLVTTAAPPVLGLRQRKSPGAERDWEHELGGKLL